MRFEVSETALWGELGPFPVPLFALQLQVSCGGHAVAGVAGRHHQVHHCLHLGNLFGFNELHDAQLTLWSRKGASSRITSSLHSAGSTCSSCSALHWASPITLLTAYTLMPGGGWGRPWPAALTAPSTGPPWEDEGAGRVGDSFSTKLKNAERKKTKVKF